MPINNDELKEPVNCIGMPILILLGIAKKNIRQRISVHVWICALTLTNTAHAHQEDMQRYVALIAEPKAHIDR